MNLWKHSQRRIFHGQLWVRNMILLMRHTTFIMLMLRYWALAAESAIHGFDLREKSDIELHLSFAGMISIHAYERLPMDDSFICTIPWKFKQHLTLLVSSYWIYYGHPIEVETINPCSFSH
ncbi:hypothetical protein SDJN02_13265 [Cucurbita argyrosperma subsp. argyrosperma]|nr:hypothetical protein SDJN02_13265 [Cucurbita argyrosperma subsp. argyrosperma]